MARKTLKLRGRLNRRSGASKKVSKSKPVAVARKPTVKKPLAKSVSERLKAQVRQVSAAISSSQKVTVIRGPKEVESSWVDSIAYVRKGRRYGVAIKFLNGFEAFYPGTTVKDYEYLRDAKSKGRAVWRRFYELRYEALA